MKLLKLLGTVTSLVLLSSSVNGAPASSATSDVDLQGLSIGDIINALGIGLVNHIDTNITLDTLTTNLVSIDFDIKNPLILELTLDSVSSTAGINGTVYAQFTHTFSTPVVVPILGTANSGKIPDVLLTQGAIASLGIIPLGYLDLIDTDVNVRVATINGHLGIPLTITGLKQNNVSVTYNLDLSSP